jgi:DNA-directed RNA polymerase specialized sigma24 family protein
MDDVGTITRCIRDLEVGQTPRRDAAARELWEYFFADLMCYARRKLHSAHAVTGFADEEDAAERAFTKVCHGIERGQLKLGNRIDLYKVLRSATTHEVIKHLHHSKRHVGHTSDDAVLAQLPDTALTPELLLLAYDACQRLLDLLEFDELRRIAIWKLAGYTNEAIRSKVGCSLATLERLLAHIRETWRQKWDAAIPKEPAKPGPRRVSSRGGEGWGADAMSGLAWEDANQTLRRLAGLASTWS